MKTEIQTRTITEATGITITLDRREATLLQIVLGNIGGNRNHPIRAVTSELFGKLNKVCDNDLYYSIDKTVQGTIVLP